LIVKLAGKIYVIIGLLNPVSSVLLLLPSAVASMIEEMLKELWAI